MSNLFVQLTSENGDFYVNGSESTGAQGPQGFQGSQGPQGLQGNNDGDNLSTMVLPNFCAVFTSVSMSTNNNVWSSIGISSSGQYQIAVTNSSDPSINDIYQSSDYGSNWLSLNTQLSNKHWSSVAISASGQYRSATINNGTIYYSLNSGVTWQSSNAPISNYSDISMSSSGQYQTAVINRGYIYNSIDYGVTWTQNNSAPSKEWTSISISGFGQYQSAVEQISGTNLNGGYIYNSNDYGMTWTPNNSSSGSVWKSIAVSNSGMYQIACRTTGAGKAARVFMSNDYGITWDTKADSDSFKHVSISASGQYCIICANSRLYSSINYGIDIQIQTTGSFLSSAISSNGQYATILLSSLSNTGYKTECFPIPNPLFTDSRTNVVVYDATKKLFNYTSKTFVIDHPTKSNKYLVHGCLEGPEGGIYYRGKNKIDIDNKCIIKLPDYVNEIGCDFTINVTNIIDIDNIEISKNMLLVTEVKNNEFIVYGINGQEFYWIVFGKRITINIEPDKNMVNIFGKGPYQWIE